MALLILGVAAAPLLPAQSLQLSSALTQLEPAALLEADNWGVWRWHIPLLRARAELLVKRFGSQKDTAEATETEAAARATAVAATAAPAAARARAARAASENERGVVSKL